MVVLLTNTTLGVRRRVDNPGRNEHGEKVRAGWTDMSTPLPGRTNEAADASWSLGVDPSLWPVREGDLIIATAGQHAGASWLVQTSDLIQNNYDHRIDWIRVSALRRAYGGTAPADGWFVARYADNVEPDPVIPQEPQAGLWSGFGPPPDDLVAEPGDEYIDLTTGIVYTFGED